MDDILNDLAQVIERKKAYYLKLAPLDKGAISLLKEIQILERSIAYFHAELKNRDHHYLKLLMHNQRIKDEKYRLELLCMIHGMIDFAILADRPSQAIFNDWADSCRKNMFEVPTGLRPVLMPQAIHNHQQIIDYFKTVNTVLNAG